VVWFKKKQKIDSVAIAQQALWAVEDCKLDRHLLRLQLQESPTLNASYAAFLKHCLDIAPDATHTLADEVDLLKQYIACYANLQHTPIFVKTTLAIHSDCNNIQIPVFMLFPLVQNALVGGYNVMEKFPLRIRLSADNYSLKLEVSNRVNHYVQSQADSIGIQHFKSRLQHTYTDRQELFFNSNSALFKATLMLKLK